MRRFRFIVAAVLLLCCAFILDYLVSLSPQRLFFLWTQEDELIQAIRRVDGKALLSQFALRTGAEKDSLSHFPPFLVSALAEMDEDVTEEARVIIDRVLSMNFSTNGDGSYMLHPLSNALRREKYVVAERLLQDNSTVREVFAAMLSCDAIERLDSSIVVVSDDAENRNCVLSHPRRRRHSESRLVALYKHLHTSAKLPSFHASVLYHYYPIVAPPSTVRAGAWNDPFHPPPLSALPPRDATVMNPAVFDDFFAAVSYYFFGPPWPPGVGIAVLTCVIVFEVVIVTSFFNIKAQRRMGHPQRQPRRQPWRWLWRW